MWGNEPEPCVFLSLWFSSQSPSAPPQLQENITRSARQQPVSLFLIVLTNKTCACSLILSGYLCVDLWAVCDWRVLSSCIQKPLWISARLQFSGSFSSSWCPSTCCHDLSFSAPAAQSDSHTKKVKSDYEGLCPKWQQKKKHFLLSSLNMISKDLQRSTIVNPTLTASVAYRQVHTARFWKLLDRYTTDQRRGSHITHGNCFTTKPTGNNVRSSARLDFFMLKLCTQEVCDPSALICREWNTNFPLPCILCPQWP